MNGPERSAPKACCDELEPMSWPGLTGLTRPSSLKIRKNGICYVVWPSSEGGHDIRGFTAPELGSRPSLSPRPPSFRLHGALEASRPCPSLPSAARWHPSAARDGVRGAEEILAARDKRDVLKVIVHCDAEMIAGGHILAGQHHIAEVQRRRLDASCGAVAPA